MIAWTIKSAAESTILDRVIVSSNDPEVISIARESGGDVPFRRPERLASDDTPAIEVLRHAVDALDRRYDLVVWLQPTSPLRTAGDVDGAIRACVETGAPACISVAPASQAPYLMMAMDEGTRLQPLLDAKGATRRQDLPDAYIINGAVYVAETDYVLERGSFLTERTIGYVMPRERSIDIDDPLDLRIASFLLADAVGGTAD
ncbi:hypothetical protein [Azospirillum palustre]